MIADIEIFSSEAFREKKARKITRDSHDKGKGAEIRVSSSVRKIMIIKISYAGGWDVIKQSF